MNWDFWFQPSQNDRDQGRIALKYFNNASVGYISYKGFNIDTLSRKLDDDESNFTGRFGFEIKKIAMADSVLKERMELLAKKSRGLIPEADSFYKVLQGNFVDLEYLTDFSDNYPTATSEFIEQAQKDVKVVADVGFDTLKSLGTFAPIIIVGGVLIISWSYINKLKAA
jgi:hypothetical protein